MSEQIAISAAAKADAAQAAGTWFVGAMAVHRDWRGKGLGKTLLQFADRKRPESGARQMSLIVERHQFDGPPPLRAAWVHGARQPANGRLPQRRTWRQRLALHG
jgi:GNAT superfamily N-acetyltransferase